MLRERGFVEMVWIYAAVGLVIVTLGGIVAVQTMRLNSVKSEFAEFRGGVAAVGKAAKLAADAQELADRQRKEKTDAENEKVYSNFRSTIKRLRDQRPSGSFVPPAPAGTAGTNTVAFDRPELESAIRALDSGLQGLVDEGSKAVIDLDTAKRWAHGD